MKLELSDPELNVLAEALYNLPYRQAAPVIASIQKQLQEKEHQNVQTDPSPPQT